MLREEARGRLPASKNRGTLLDTTHIVGQNAYEVDEVIIGQEILARYNFHV
jgi:hypothetical protein